VDLLAGKRVTQRADDRNGCRYGALAVETRASRGERCEQIGIASERALVGGDDGGAAVERRANPLPRVRCAAGLDDDVDAWIRRETGRVANERCADLARIPQVRAQDGDASQRQARAGDVLEPGATLGERVRERGSDSAVADEAELQDGWRHSALLLPPASPRSPGGQKKSPGDEAAETRGLLAVCLTWPQYAANHHETVFDCVRMSNERPLVSQEAPDRKLVAKCWCLLLGAADCWVVARSGTRSPAAAPSYQRQLTFRVFRRKKSIRIN
jgi:hypothetical protein